MSEGKIPTIEDLIVSKTGQSRPLKANLYLLTTGDVMNIAREFARLHVAAALKAASEKAQLTGEWDGQWNDDRLQTRDADGHWIDVVVDPNSIVASYSLENIK